MSDFCDDLDPPYDRPDIDECEHEHSDVDIMTGEFHCYSCGYHRLLAGDEIEREANFQAEMMEAYYLACDEAERNGAQAP
jgi:hypothetical protein